MSTFDYVEYDEAAAANQAKFKEKFEELEAMAISLLPASRETSLVRTKLEEGYMWVGKSIRNEQILRNRAAVQIKQTEGETNV